MSDADHGYVLFNGLRYQIDQSESQLTAHIFPQGLSWNLEVSTLDDPCCDDVAPSMDVSFQVAGLKDWRELANRRLLVDYKGLVNEQLLPSSPAGLYVGYHVFPDQHEILFGDRKAAQFRVEWHLEASHQRDSYSLDVIGTIPFTATIVHFPDDVPKFHSNVTQEEIEAAYKEWEPDLLKAQQLIASSLDNSDFGTPQKWRWALSYPLVTSE